MALKDVFFSKAYEGTGASPNPKQTRPIDTLKMQDVIFFRDPAFPDYATRPTEAGVITSIVRGANGKPAVLVIAPLTKQDKKDFVDNTDDFWIINREDHIIEMGLNKRWNYKLGMGSVQRNAPSEMLRVIPITEVLINPGTPNTALVIGECPEYLWARMETRMKKLQSVGDFNARLIQDVNAAYRNRENLSMLARPLSGFPPIKP